MLVSTVLAVAGEFPTYFVLVYVVGLVAAVSLGLVAWYNSKRPVGWERSQRPGFIPKVNTGVDQEPLKFEQFEPVESADPDLSITPTPANGPETANTPEGENHHGQND